MPDNLVNTSMCQVSAMSKTQEKLRHYNSSDNRHGDLYKFLTTDTTVTYHGWEVGGQSKLLYSQSGTKGTRNIQAPFHGRKREPNHCMGGHLSLCQVEKETIRSRKKKKSLSIKRPVPSPVYIYYSKIINSISSTVKHSEMLHMQRYATVVHIAYVCKGMLQQSTLHMRDH